jgi:hypothetical protein
MKPVLRAASRLLPPFLLCCLSFASTGLAATPKVVWDHPWLNADELDTTDISWIERWDRPGKAAWVFDRQLTRFEYAGDGTLVQTWELEIRIQEPSEMVGLMHIGSLGGGEAEDVQAMSATITAGGTTTELPSSAFILRTAEADSLYLAGEVSVLLSLPTARTGTLNVEFRVSRRTPPAPEGSVSGWAALHGFGHCALREIEVVVPEDVELALEQRHFEAPVAESVDGGRRTYRLELQKLAALRFEAGMPNQLDALPLLFWSNLDSWAALGQVAAEAWEPHMQASPELVAWAEGAVPEQASHRQRALAIHDAVAGGWDYLGFYPAESGWLPHDAELCWRSRLGDCKDRTALMVAAMRAVGLEAWPAVVWRGRRFEQPSIPVLIANHAAVWVADEGSEEGGFILDSVDAGTGALSVGTALSERQALVLRPGSSGLVTIPPVVPEEHISEDRIRVELDTDGRARVAIVERRTGEQANRLAARAGDASEERWDYLLDRRLRRAIPGARLESFVYGPDPDDPEVWLTEVELVSDELVTWSGDHGVLELPWANPWTGDRRRVYKRKWPRELPMVRSRAVIELVLPEGLAIAQRPHRGTVDGSIWRSTYDVQETGDGLEIVHVVEVDPVRMQAKREEGRRQLIRFAERMSRRFVVVRREVTP